VVTASGATVVVTKTVFVIVEVISGTRRVIVAVAVTVVVRVAVDTAACLTESPSPVRGQFRLRDPDAPCSRGTIFNSVSKSFALLIPWLIRDVAVTVAVCVLLVGSVHVRVSNTVDADTDTPVSFLPGEELQHSTHQQSKDLLAMSQSS